MKATVDRDVTTKKKLGRSPNLPQITARVGLVLVGIAIWFWTQALLGERELAPGESIGDALLQATAGVNAYLNEHPRSTNLLLIVSSLTIDLLALFLMIWSVFGRSIRPFLGLVILFLLRQIVQAICALPPPEGILWHDPGFPSLFVTYSVSNDFFFSGHTAISVFGAIELARLRNRWFVIGAVVIILFQVILVLMLRAHYTMDVFAGLMTALFAAQAANKLSPMVDRFIGRLSGGFGVTSEK